MRRAALALLMMLAAAAPAAAGQARPVAQPGRPVSRATAASCLRALDGLGVSYKAARRRGISIGVQVRGPLGGVTFRSYDDCLPLARSARRPGDCRGVPLVLDCSLVYSLAVAGRYLVEAGLTDAAYSSAYQRRNIRGTSRPSRHSFGLAIDVHQFTGPDGAELRVVDDYEQGLGDDVDCVGAPLTEAGATLRTLACRFARSGLFRIVLTPDYDADHFNHFHLEARPWAERAGE